MPQSDGNRSIPLWSEIVIACIISLNVAESMDWFPMKLESGLCAGRRQRQDTRNDGT